MNKSTTLPALSEKRKAAENHRVKPEPFQNQIKTPPGYCYCTECGAISFQKRWYIDPRLEQKLRRNLQGHAILCPGCTRLDQQLFEGEVVVANAKFATQAGEIIALIKHTEGRCWHHNPLAKISAFADDQAVIHIQTTTKLLAAAIAKELHKAFKGKLAIKRSHEERLVRIYWTD